MKKRRNRKRRRRNAPGKNSVVKFFGIVGIIVIAVVCGYMTARFVLAPLLGYDTEVLKLDFPSKLTSKISSITETSSNESKKSKESQEIDEKRLSDEEEKTGYYLQFGVFDSREGAGKLVKQLSEEGIEARIREKNGQFRVISGLIRERDAAMDKLKSIKTNKDTDVFLTSAN